MGAVYEATQPSVGRAVAIRLIPAEHFESAKDLEAFDRRQRVAASVHHPNLVPLYEAGEWEDGRFVATRLVRGSTLGELRASGQPPMARTLEPLAEALRVAHAAGVVHGSVSAENILVEADGTPHLADLGLRPPGSAEADARSLAAIASRLPEEGQAPRRGARSPIVLALVVVIAVAAAAIVALTSGGEPDEVALPPPPSPRGTEPLGSQLEPAEVGSLSCAENPSPNTPACTIAQTSLAGKAVTVTRAGVIRSWVVRGASGDLSLQVIRERGNRAFVAGFSQLERFTDPVPRAIGADIAIRPGDRIGVRLAPGASIGARLSSRGSEVTRWDGGLTADSRAPPGAPLEGELMLRVDVAPGARPRGPDQLLGDRARAAPAGRVLADTALGLAPRRAARVVLVEVSGEIALDVVLGERRLSRIAVPDADPDGELAELVPTCGGVGGFCLIWRNPGGEPTLSHVYRLRPSGRITLIG